MHSPRKRVLGLLGGLALIAVLGVSATSSASSGGAVAKKFTAKDLSPAAIETIKVAKSDSGRLAQTDPTLLGRTDSTPINVMIKYDFDATASYKGGVAGLAPTSPRVTRKKLKDNVGAVGAYEAHIRQVAQGISARVQQAGAKVRKSFLTVYGGVEAQIPANQVSSLLRIEGVAAVQRDTLNQPLDDNTQFIGATKVWPSLGGRRTAGSNVIVGVLDTGIWPEHPMMSNQGIPAPDGGLRGCQFGNGSDPLLGPAFSCNNKLIGAYAFTDTYLALVGSDGHEFCDDAAGVCSPRDSEGHGTHTTTTAAGDCVNSAVLYGVQRGPVCGIAPGAHVIMYRVCLSQGCFSSDSVAAVQQAIRDGVDVINFSISGGAQPYSDPVEIAFLDAVNSRISVNASAGNSGPGAGTADHGGPWVTTVGASTGPRFFTTTLHLTADGGATFDKGGVTVTNGISSPTPVVMAESLPGEDALCQSPLAPGTATGKIVACRRGVNARVDKGFNVLQGGAVGMILYNAVKQDVETDNHWLPAVHVDGPNDDLVAFITGHTNVRATWAQGQPTATQPDVMAAFSSRGPTGDWIKPDVTAPGIQVLAGMTPQPDETTPTNGPPGNLYQAIAGTSMSSPHAAGVSALVKAAHPDWTPEEIKSALMTSSVQSVVKEDGVTPADPFDMGAGSIRADRAVNPTLVFDENSADFVAAGTDPVHRIDLNLASVDAPTMTGTIVTKRTATNVTGAVQSLHVTTVAPAGANIYVSDKKPNQKGEVRPDDTISLKKKTTDIWIEISAPTLPDGQYFGRITLDPGGRLTPVTIPVAFFRQQGLVTLTHDCSPNAFPARTGHAHCSATVSNLASIAASVDLKITNLDRGRGLNFSNVVGPAGTTVGSDGIEWNGTLSPALAPTIDSITSTTGPAGGYLPLSAFGIPAVPGVDDDSITNFSVPTFYYGGEAYTEIGVVSNGYVVIGGGDGSDVVFTPQTFPDPERPNNVVAPLWNDLNPGAGGAIRVATLTDGIDTWIVVDYDAVKNFTDSTTHTMELWFRTSGGGAGTGPVSEQTTISYGAADTASPDPGSGGNSGAENRDGSSGKNLTTPADNTEWAVNTSPPTAGGSATIEYDASANRPGTYRSVASMTSNVTPGTTQVVQTLTATSP